MRKLILDTWRLTSATIGTLCTLYIIYLAIRFFNSPLCCFLNPPILEGPLK